MFTKKKTAGWDEIKQNVRSIPARWRSGVDVVKKAYRAYGSRTGEIRDPDMDRSWADDMRAITDSLAVKDPEDYRKFNIFPPSGLGGSFGFGDAKCNGYVSEVYTRALGSDFWHDPETNRMRNVNTLYKLIKEGKYKNPHYRLVQIKPEEARYTPGVLALEPGLNGASGHASIMGADGVYKSASASHGVRPHPEGRAARHRNGVIYVVPVRSNISDAVFREQHKTMIANNRKLWGTEYRKIDDAQMRNIRSIDIYTKPGLAQKLSSGKR